MEVSIKSDVFLWDLDQFTSSLGAFSTRDFFPPLSSLIFLSAV